MFWFPSFRDWSDVSGTCPHPSIFTWSSGPSLPPPKRIHPRNSDLSGPHLLLSVHGHIFIHHFFSQQEGSFVHSHFTQLHQYGPLRFRQIPRHQKLENHLFGNPGFTFSQNQCVIIHTFGFGSTPSCPQQRRRRLENQSATFALSANIDLMTPGTSAASLSHPKDSSAQQRWKVRTLRVRSGGGVEILTVFTSLGILEIQEISEKYWHVQTTRGVLELCRTLKTLEDIFLRSQSSIPTQHMWACRKLCNSCTSNWTGQHAEQPSLFFVQGFWGWCMMNSSPASHRDKFWRFENSNCTHYDPRLGEIQCGTTVSWLQTGRERAALLHCNKRMA